MFRSLSSGERTVGFSTVTEHHTTRASADQLALAATRYSLVRSLAGPGLVVEVGCGSAIGLAKLHYAGLQCVGIDLDVNNIRAASRLESSLALCVGDGLRLPLRPSVAAATALLEAIYYVNDQPALVAELARVTAPGGGIVISWPNPARPGFIQSELATRYPSTDEVESMLAPHCSSVELTSAMPFGKPWSVQNVARRIAAASGLVPGSLAARGLLKTIFRSTDRRMGDLLLDGPAYSRSPVASGSPCTDVMFYAVGTRR